MKLIVPLPMSRTELREGQVTAESPKTPAVPDGNVTVSVKIVRNS
jgi:hypothetical protein